MIIDPNILTEEQKDKIKEEYNDSIMWLNEEDLNSYLAHMRLDGVIDQYAGRAFILEKIFGKEFFND